MSGLKSEENVIPGGLYELEIKLSSDNRGQNILVKLVELSGTEFSCEMF